ncbi:5-oxoprolinase subunit C family protein [Vibrio gallicus]|uniref:5-oxoprolinase subunit C family protein n=1 Tax=Vibrio gallicus TaxID=190897 RepID=UPI0021C318BF|nr:biotin-dependent carboxyltransferase family protein [Vibrio gallicus]
MIATAVVVRAHQGCSIQDSGRCRLAHYGMSQGGVADEYAFHWANKLLGNLFNSAVIEVTLGGLELKFLKATHFSVSGAKNNACLDQTPIASWQTYYAAAGQHLVIGVPRDGLRNYVAFNGGLIAKSDSGSVSTSKIQQLGGLKGDGSSLQFQDILYCNTPRTTLKHAFVSADYVPQYSDTIDLRVTLGSQVDGFAKTELVKLFTTPYKITAAADKMGYQLQGEPLLAPQTDLISEPITLGAIQVPSSGHPIIMLCERQTIGGYHKLGNVVRMDISKLAQAKPGQRVKFHPADLENCRKQYQDWLQYFNQPLNN